MLPLRQLLVQAPEHLHCTHGRADKTGTRSLTPARFEQVLAHYAVPRPRWPSCFARCFAGAVWQCKRSRR